MSTDANSSDGAMLLSFCYWWGEDEHSAQDFAQYANSSEGALLLSRK